MNTGNLHIRIDKELLDDFRKQASIERLSVSEILRGMIVKHLRDRRIDQSVKRLSNED